MNLFIEVLKISKIEIEGSNLKVILKDVTNESVIIIFKDIFSLNMIINLDNVRFIRVDKESSHCLDIRLSQRISDDINLYECIFFGEKSTIIGVRIVANEIIMLDK
jgi:hypothetical protein